MADLTGYTPIYIRTTGNDTTGNGSLASPYATAQKAFDTAIVTASGDYVLDFGAGNFGNISVSQDWPNRITITGLGPSVSNIGNIYSYGANEILDWETFNIISEATSGNNINISSLNNSISINNIISSGGSSERSNAGNAGYINIYNITANDIISAGGFMSDNGFPQYSNGLSNTIYCSGCLIRDIISNPNNSYTAAANGVGGTLISVVDSSVRNIYSNGGDGGEQPGDGGNINLNKVGFNNIYNNGGSGPYGSSNGGNTILINSTGNNISSIGYQLSILESWNNNDNKIDGIVTLFGTSCVIDTVLSDNIIASGFTGSNPSGNFYFGLGDRLIHIDPSGNDTTGNGSSESPYATAQKAFQIAMSTGNAAVINLSSGNFGVVSLDSAAPDKDLSQYIRLSGISEGLSSISTLTANSGQKISLTANNISINNIIASGSNLFCYGNYPIPTGMICASGNFIDLKRGKNFNRNNLLGLI